MNKKKTTSESPKAEDLIFGVTFNAEGTKASKITTQTPLKLNSDSESQSSLKPAKNRTLKGMKKQLEKLQMDYNTRILNKGKIGYFSNNHANQMNDVGDKQTEPSPEKSDKKTESESKPRNKQSEYTGNMNIESKINGHRMFLKPESSTLNNRQFLVQEDEILSRRGGTSNDDKKNTFTKQLVFESGYTNGLHN